MKTTVPPHTARQRAAHRDAPALAVPPHSPGGVLPSVRELVEPLGPYLIPLVVLFVTRIVVWVAMPLAAEDAYITFRYAQNLVMGNGLVYNPGEHVMGFTSPGWTLWNALGLTIFRFSPEPWARLSSLLADIATLLIYGRLLTGYASRTAAWCFTAFFAAWPYFTAVSMSGMENSAMLTLIGLSAALAARGSVAAGPVLALLGLWRPEGLASAFVVALRARRRDQLVALGLLGLGLGALTLYYGSPIPQSLLAKARVYGTPGPLAGRAWWDWIIPFQYRGWPNLGETNMLLPLMVLMFPAFVMGLRKLWEIRGSALSVAVAAGLVVWLGYALSGVAYFFWYFVVPLGSIVAACAVGLPLVVRGRWLYVSIVLLIAGVWTIAPLLYVGRAQGEYFAFADAGEYLRKAASPGDRVLLEPIGLIGWEAPVHVIDEVGLVTPWIAERRMRGPGWYTDVVTAARPRWLVIRRGEQESGVAFAGAGAPFRNSVERDSVFARYRLATELQPDRGDAALQIWRRER